MVPSRPDSHQMGGGDGHRVGVRPRGAVGHYGVRLTEFWRRMDAVFGTAYAQSWAADFAVAALGGRTVVEALAQGESAKDVWRAVCESVEVPRHLV